MSFVPHLEQETKGKNPDASLKGSSSGVGADAAAECELDAIARSRDLGFQHHLVWEWERRGTKDRLEEEDNRWVGQPGSTG